MGNPFALTTAMRIKGVQRGTKSLFQQNKNHFYRLKRELNQPHHISTHTFAPHRVGEDEKKVKTMKLIVLCVCVSALNETIELIPISIDNAQISSFHFFGC